MEFIGANLIAIAAVAVTLVTIVVAGIMFILGSQRTHYLWGAFCLFAALWSFSFFLVTQAQSEEMARLWWKVAYIGIIMSPVVFFNFILEFTGKINRFFINSVYVIGFGLVLVSSSTNLVVDQMRYVFGFYYDSPAAPLQPLTTALYAVLVLITHIVLFRAYRESNDIYFKRRTEYFFLATSIGFLGSGLNFLPVYGIDVNPITLSTLIISWPLIGYTILRFGLFNVRVVTAQLLTLILTIFALTHIVLSKTQEELIINSLLLLITFGVGIYLIRSVSKEVEQREEIERLAENLEKANARLKEMDQLKNQFLSIASHDLRAPLTAIRNFMSLLLDNTYGKLPAAAEEGTQQVYERATEMADMVDNYLNVSRIEQGRMKYDFENIDFKDTLNEAIDAFAPVAEEKGLTFNYTDITEPLPMRADEPKLREVVENLINNAINYTPEGSIEVSVQRTGDRVQIVIEDTGIGMSEKTIKNLFGLFAPGEDSRKYNPKSTGVGLYITKAHVEAHKGTVRAESDGEGKGSRFVVELPLTP